MVFQLLSFGEDSFRTRRIVSICKLFRRHQDPEEKISHTKDTKFESG